MSGVQHLLGKIIEGSPERDAIHVAVAPVTAAERLRPGQHVGLDGQGEAIGGELARLPIGVVDPFLEDDVRPGEGFWLFLYPGSTAVLRHEWTHPAFPLVDKNVAVPKAANVSPEKAEAIAWIEDFANSIDTSYRTVMEGAWNYVEGEEYMIQGGRWEGVYTPDEFWPRYEIVTGEKVPENKRGNFFSCSC